jgi:hypothetical protein
MLFFPFLFCLRSCKVFISYLLIQTNVRITWYDNRIVKMGFLYKLRNNGDEFDVRINRAAEFWLSQIEEMRTLRLDEAHLAAELFDAVVKSLEEKEPVDLIFLRALFNKVEEVTASINNSSPIDRIIMTLSKQQMRQIIKDIDND